MKEYFLSAIAEQDIDEIISYIAQENANAALTFLDSLYESMNMLPTRVSDPKQKK